LSELVKCKSLKNFLEQISPEILNIFGFLAGFQ
jgi:hypothetical protein